MQLTDKILHERLTKDFNYHDAQIIKITKNKNDIILLLTDGFNEGQKNELTFTNCELNHNYELEERYIYQLDDLVYFDGNGCYMSLLVWMKDNDLIEKVTFECDNITAVKK